MPKEKGTLNHKRLGYVPSTLTKKEKENIKKIRKQDKYPNFLKDNPHFKHLMTVRNKPKILRYLNKNKKLIYSIEEIERVCKIKR